MTLPTHERKRIVLSITLGVTASVLPFLLPFLRFLWFPGALLGGVFFGSRMVFASFDPVRAVGSALLWPVVLYAGAALLTWGDGHPTRQSPRAAKYVFWFWILLLLPWLLVAPVSLMAFDGGYTAEAYAFVWSVWSYPVTLGIVAVFRRWVPWIVLLPLLNLVGCGASELLHK